MMLYGEINTYAEDQKDESVIRSTLVLTAETRADTTKTKQINERVSKDIGEKCGLNM
jgi:hypothetical protein